MDETIKLKRGGPSFLTPTSTNILNLSRTYILNEVEHKLLEKGLLFIPTPNNVDNDELNGSASPF